MSNAKLSLHWSVINYQMTLSDSECGLERVFWNNYSDWLSYLNIKSKFLHTNAKIYVPETDFHA